MRLAFLFPLLLAPAVAALSAPRPAPLSYDRDVRPILAASCFACHGFDAGKRQAGLRLDVREGAAATLPTGRRGIVPGDPGRSEVIRRVAARTMPPASTGKRLSGAEIEILRRWIAQGAPYARHWSLDPPRLPPLPAVRDPARVRNPIDRFVLARLEREGLRPSPPADRRTLVRRVTLDLTGLPPTPAEVDAFLADRSPHAYETVVDRLLASPRFGERMAWDWLDAARYADTNGYQGDRTRTLWPWRDWVVRAFNADLPFDQFTVEQLAGDLLPGATLDQRIATGFNRNHPLNGEGGRIPEESRVDYVVDRVDTTSTVWLGLTLGCARCHDHKYDPFTQKEYYRLYAYFNNLPESGGVDRGGNAEPVLALPTPEQSARLAELDARIRDLEARIAAAPAGSPEAAALRTSLEEGRQARRALQDQILVTMVMEERSEPRDTHVLIRGAWDRSGEKVTPGVPAALPPLPAGAPPNRLALARWIVDPSNPLTARVAVNRFWQLFFGAGLVRTPEDFGTQGERPSHPELLDYLAVVFQSPAPARTAGSRSPAAGLGWSMKKLVRLIVTSATYRQSSRVTAELRERDPENRLLARGPRFRLPSPVLRDQALALSGLLVEKQGGPPVKPYQPPGVWEDATFGQIRYEQDHGEALHRRSLYIFWRRIVAPTSLFDTASRQTCTVRQIRTNTPLHALVLLNDVTYVEAARAFAERVLREAGAGPAARVDHAFRLAAARPPSAAERSLLLARLARLRDHYRAHPEAARKLLAAGEAPRDERLDPVEHAAFAALCSLILNLDEVVTRE